MSDDSTRRDGGADFLYIDIDYDYLADETYVGMQLAQELRHGEPNAVTVLRSPSNYPVLVRGGRMLSRSQVFDFFESVLDGIDALPEGTDYWFAKEVDAEKVRLAEARREREEKKLRGPVKRSGFVYLIADKANPYASGRGVKIGWSSDPERRARELDGMKKYDERECTLRVLCCIPTEHVHTAERLMHTHFKHLRRGKSEWFDLTPDHAAWFEADGPAFLSERGAG